MEQISSSDIKSAEELIKLGKNIGDEMNPDVDMDNGHDKKLNISSIIKEKKPEVKIEEVEKKVIKKKSIKIFRIKDAGILEIILMCVVVCIITGLITWFFIS